LYRRRALLYVRLLLVYLTGYPMVRFSIVCSYAFERNIPNPKFFLLIVYWLLTLPLSLNIYAVRTIVQCVRCNGDLLLNLYVLMWCYRRLLSCDRLTIRTMVECIRCNADYCSSLSVLMCCTRGCYRVRLFSCDRLTVRTMVECIRCNHDYCSSMYVLMWCYR
jgi:hypothetical protein